MTESTDITVGSGARVSGHAALMIACVGIVGMIAAMEVSSLILAPTLVMAWLLGREANRASLSRPALIDYPEFPPELRATVDRTMEQLPDGDARRLLSDSLAQARPLLAPHQGALDESQESATRNNVLSLVDACCMTALELARLDAASGARDPSAGPDAASRAASARELLTRRLSRAATALASLYAAGVMHGSPASDRVAELADEINADANARLAAANEISALLGKGEQPPPAEPPKG